MFFSVKSERVWARQNPPSSFLAKILAKIFREMDVDSVDVEVDNEKRVKLSLKDGPIIIIRIDGSFMQMEVHDTSLEKVRRAIPLIEWFSKLFEAREDED